MLHDHRLTFDPRGLALPFVRLEQDAAHSETRSVQVAVTSDLDDIANDWRMFEQAADCTPFQTFAWLSTWQRCIGARAGVVPAILTGRRPTGELLFLLPLAVERGKFVKQLVFLGRGLCDYNAPLLAADFSDHVSAAEFAALWSSARRLLQQTVGCAHDLVFLDKMPE